MYTLYVVNSLATCFSLGAVHFLYRSRDESTHPQEEGMLIGGEG